ncbi:acylneuraminate cytidylyltransferase family protein [Chlorobium sp. KB01]|uniref:acylneuraminate cytidylyltransferase family protein n=1 Tax=Chlorobium sp. KB01 TaxID=1917528 RepID=UPI00097806DA|nr:acylneuraminate cytidylyltransferase family protein [Chlorobium sp. KB01]
MRKVAFIPARSGSKRIPDKNIRFLNGHPLLAYSVRAAIECGVFDAVICATDSERYAEVARYYGAEVPVLRMLSISGDKSPDFEWVIWLLEELRKMGKNYDVFSILRPTSPFRLPETIVRAWETFINDPSADSLRAVEKCRQHPGKMWMLRSKRMFPLLPFENGGTPWHSSQYASLPEVYVQDASLEIAWSRIAIEHHSIAGESIIPFVSREFEGFDINEPEDWLLAEHYISAGLSRLPEIAQPPYQHPV